MAELTMDEMREMQEQLQEKYKNQCIKYSTRNW